jgi:hypothetical protein
MGNGHDHAVTSRERGVEVIATINAHPLHEIVTREAADEQEVHEHATVVLEGATRDTPDLRV